ncbi:hypothetical protein EIP91_008517 [Steccherinum ochraceum]|uniref:Epoxide hydrolase N-terminal domain-containing protein n=1 Tax=Steccherinum ochraceum TaxID=92696 RepID=A0A4R0R529_9APHY|nr:hypothetical protein EIP91_008517 [Steccherinum ochraceum]
MSHPEQIFTLSIPDSELAYLRKKLEDVRFPDELNESGWDYGTPLTDVRRLVARWKDGYDWRAAEAKINTLPQFTRDIDVDQFGTLNIHYVHAKSQAKDAIPLLFAHGWPGHFLEVAKILPLLVSTGKHTSFHVVALSHPGFGFSEDPKKRGFGIKQYAEVAHKLMLALGYDEYVAQGGDWGYSICRMLAYLYGPKHVKAWHTNMPLASAPTLRENPRLYLQNLITPLSAEDVKGLQRQHDAWEILRKGFTTIQELTPQTIGYFMADSPTGLLSWIYEKLIRWTDNYPWEDDEVLTWVSIYWFSRAGPTAAARIYYEYFKNVAENMPPYSPVPLGVAYFPKELLYAPKLWMRTVGDVVFTSEHPAGGHFAAHEQPEALVSDIRTMFSKTFIADSPN